MSEGVATQLRKLLEDRPLPTVNWECHIEAGYKKAIEDVLAVLATHICVNKQELQDFSTHTRIEDWLKQEGFVFNEGYIRVLKRFIQKLLAGGVEAT